MPSARGATSCSSLCFPESPPAQFGPPGSRAIWRSYNMADIDNKEQPELDQDLADVEEVEGKKK